MIYIPYLKTADKPLEMTTVAGQKQGVYIKSCLIAADVSSD